MTIKASRTDGNELDSNDIAMGKFFDDVTNFITTNYGSTYSVAIVAVDREEANASAIANGGKTARLPIGFITNAVHENAMALLRTVLDADDDIRDGTGPANTSYRLTNTSH